MAKDNKTPEVEKEQNTTEEVVNETPVVEEATAPVTEEPKNEEPEKKKSNHIFIKAGVILLVILAIIALLLKSCGGPVDVPNNDYVFEMDENAVQGGINDTNRQEIIDKLNEQVKASMFEISMNTQPYFQNGTSEGTLNIMNSEDNAGKLMVVEIYRDDTQELIYKSAALKPGYKKPTDTLDVDLEAGQYKCTAYFMAISEETNKLIGKVGAKITITVAE